MKRKPTLSAIYKIGTYKSLDSQLAEYFHIDPMKEYIGRTIYLVKNPKDHDTIYFASFQNNTSISAGIIQSIDTLKMINLQNISLILSTYPHQDIHLQSCPIINEHLDSFLSETNGWLVYTHQLEFLYMMATQKNHEEATEFRKKFNSKNATFLNTIPDYPLFGTTLNTIIAERLIHPSKTVVRPQYALGYKLFEYLSE